MNDLKHKLLKLLITIQKKMQSYLPFLVYSGLGLLLPLGFAPFHLPGLSLLGLTVFYLKLNQASKEAPFLKGFFFGLGFFGLGVSWVYVSIHDYGHLHGLLAALITLLFVAYLALFPAFTAYFFSRLVTNPHTLMASLAFSALWTLSEFLRSSLFSGFPWLLLGFGQFDTPLKYLLPFIGVFGLSFIACFSALLLAQSFTHQGLKRRSYILACVCLILSPLACKNIPWNTERAKPLSVGLIQANLSMRDKWDETLFWRLIDTYWLDIKKLLGHDLIVMPESAIPLPASYISDLLNDLQEEAKTQGSAILLGIPITTSSNDESFFNGLMGLGQAKGQYHKQHLVPFGEYIPKLFSEPSRWLGIPEVNLQAGKANQAPIKIKSHPIASLICYELAYGELLRKQLPRAEWIVSISDNGWFGHSFAMYQQQQMAQVRSLQTARYQIVSNNDGLSSLINAKGEIIASLPAYAPGLLQGQLYPSSGQTPWVMIGDWPSAILSLFILMVYFFYASEPIAANDKRRYPYPLKQNKMI